MASRIARALARGLRWLVVSVLVVLVLAGILLSWATGTKSGRAFVLERVVALLEDSVLTADIEAGSLDRVVGRVVLRDVTLRDAGGRLIADARRLEASYALWPLLSRSVRIPEIRLDARSVDVVFDENGQMNMAALVRPSEGPPPEGPPWSVSLESIVLDVDLLRVLDVRAEPPELATLQNVEAVVGVAVRADGGVHVGLDHLAAGMLHPVERQLAASNVSLELEEGGISASVKRLAFGELVVERARGAVAFDASGAPSRLDVELPPVTISPDDVAPWMPEGLALAGPIELAVSAGGAASDVAFTVTARQEMGALELDGNVDITDTDRLGYGGAITLVRFDPQDWIVGAPDADLSLTVIASGRGFDPDTLTADVRLDAGPSRFAGVGLAGAFATVRMDAGNVHLDALDFWKGATRIRAEGALVRNGMSRIELDVDAPDLSELRAELVEPSSIPTLGGSLHGTIEAEGPLGFDPFDPSSIPEGLDGWEAVLARLNATVTLNGRRLRFADHAVGALTISVEAAATGERASMDGVVRVREARTAGVAINSASATLRLRDRILDAEVSASASRPQLEATVGMSARFDEALIIGLRRTALSSAGVDVALERAATLRIELGETNSIEAIRLEDSDWNVSDVAVALSAAFEPESGRLESTLSATSVDLEALDARFALEQALTGTVGVHATAGGSLARPTLEVELSGSGVSASGVVPQDVDLSLRYDDGVGHVVLMSSIDGRPALSVSTGTSGVPLRVDLEAGVFRLEHDRPISLEATAEGLELAAILPDGVDLVRGGTLALDVGLRGTLEEPQGVGSLALSGLTLDVPVGEERWVPEPIDAVVRVQVDGSTAPWSIEASAALTMDGRRRLRGELKTVADVEEMLEDPFAALPELQLNGEIVLEELDAGDVPVWLREQLGLEQGDVWASARWTGRIRDGQGQVTVRADGVRLRDHEPFSFAGVAVLGSDVAFEAAVVHGVTQAPLDESGVPERTFGDAPGAWITIRAGAPLMAFLRGDFDGTTPVESRLVIPTFTLSEFGSYVESWTDEPGSVGGYVDVVGTLDAPVVIGRVAGRELELANGDRGSLAAELRYEGARASVDAFICEGEERGLELSASLEIPLGYSRIPDGLPALDGLVFDAAVAADDVELATVLPRALMVGLVDDVTGGLGVDIRASGTVGRPMVDGHIVIEDASLSLLPLNRTLENVALRASVSQSAFVLDELRVEDERGRLRGSGRVGLGDMTWVDASLELRARDFLLSNASGAGAFITGEITLQARQSPEGIVADTVLSDVVVEIPDDSGSSGAGPRAQPEWVYVEGEDVAREQRGRRDPEPLVAASSDASSSMPITLTVRTENPGRLTLQLGEIAFTVDLTVASEDRDFGIEGVVGLPTGTLRVAGRDFTLRDRRVTFPDGMGVIDPVLDIEAVHDLGPSVTEYLASRGLSPSGETATISVVVRGAASDLAADPENAVRLVSDPRGLSEADIFQLLASGRLANDGEEEGGQQGVTALTSLVLGLLGDQISGGIPIDTLRIESSGESQRIEGGKYIADNLYVSGTYIRSPADLDDNNFEVALEWILRQIGPGSLRLELRGGDRAKGGLELLYNLIRGR